MRSSVLFLALALPLCGLACSQSPKDKLQGKWLGDTITNVAPEQSADATAWVKGTSVEFAGDKMTVTIPAEQPKTGEFKVAKVDGKKVSLTITKEGTTDTANFRFAEDNTLHWEIGSGREVVLTKLK